MRRILFIGALLVGSTSIAQVYFVTDGTGATITSSAGVYIKSDNLVYSGAGTLTLANDAIIDGDLNAQGTKIAVSAGTVNVTGNITSSGTIEIGSGTLDCDGTFDATGGNVTFTGSGNLKIGGSVSSFGSITPGSGKITYDGGNQTVLALNGNTTTGSYNNLEIAGTGTKTLSATTIVLGNLILTSGSFDINGKTIYPRYDIVTTGGEMVSTGFGIISYKYTGTKNISGVNSPNITIQWTSAGGNVVTTGEISCYRINMAQAGKTFTVDNSAIVECANDVTLSAGSITVNSGKLTLNNSSDAVGQSFTVSGGNLTLNDGEINVGINGNTLTDLNLSSGNVVINGGTLNVCDAITMTGGAFTQAGGTVNVKSYIGSSDGNSAENKFDVTAGTLTLSGGTLNLLGQASAVNKTAMTVASGVTLNATTGHTTVITTNNTSSNDEDMYIDLNGKSLGNVTVDLNGHDLYLNNNLNILGTLTLTGGLVQLGNKQLSIGVNGSSDGSISGGSSSSYIVADLNGGDPGKLIRNINSSSGTYEFPIGAPAKYAPMTLTFTSGTLSNASVEAYTSSNRVTGMSATLERRLDRSWTVEPTGITNPNYSISYSYDPNETSGDNLLELAPVKLSGGVWYRPSNSILSNGTVMGTFTDIGNVLTWSGLTSFSEFGGGGGGSPLPVELSSFTASCQDNGVLLQWITDSEQNSSHFDVEKSNNGSDWNVITTLEAAGNSTESIMYNHLDLDKSMLNAYYRLNQVDFDGANKFYGPIHIACDNEGVRAYSFPNPSRESFNLILQNPSMLGEAQLTITDLNGKPVLEKIISIEEGINLYQYNTNNWSPGLYSIHIKSKNSEVYLKQAVE